MDTLGTALRAERLSLVRAAMARRGIAAWIAGSADPHQSEYVSERYQARAWLSGFSGSAGTFIVTEREAALWVDSRYWLEAEAVMADRSSAVFRQGQPGTPSPADWLAARLVPGDRVSAAADCLAAASAREYEEPLTRRGIVFAPGDDLLDEIWPARPPRPAAPIEAWEPTWKAGETVDHLIRLEGWLADQGADWLLAGALDEVAWLLNLRGGDVDYNPVFMAWFLAGRRGHRLYVDSARLPASVAPRLAAAGVTLRPYEALSSDLAALEAGQAIVLPPASTSVGIAAACARLRVFPLASPLAAWKARKTPAEAAALRECMIRDGRALVRAYVWLEAELAAGRPVDEHAFGVRIGATRREDARCRGESFSPIVGFGPNGAVVHYSAPEAGSRAIAGRGLLLVDTGGQYLDGTTDMTRTLLVGGTAEADERRIYTLVLKGHVRLSMARFPAGTNGAQLDTLARQPLWDQGLNYGHGTGHGVGFYLNVHEGPARIAPGPAAAGVALEPGHLMSNEPGCYLAGRFGVRIENLVLVREEPGMPGFLGFETLTLCPYERALIDISLLDPTERAWIDSYHRRVAEALLPGLDGAAAAWVRSRTAPL